MRCHFVAAAALFGQAVAYPAIMEDAMKTVERHARIEKRVDGINPGFNASLQYISTTGAHGFVPPGSGDLRGPCPGLNALANHKYLPHNGVADITEFIQATNSVFGMGLDLATFLAVYGAVVDGDLTSWSIGGPPPTSLLNPVGLLLKPQGISGSHNNYESDVSPTRGDLYQYGNDYLVQMSQFNQLYNMQSGVSDADSNYGLGLLTDFRATRFQQSTDNNPYFFNGPFSGVAVQPAAYTFMFRFFANHSAEHPEGRLTKSVLKSFFAISGPDNNLKYTPGHERIPDNWYRRAFGDEYTIPFFATDLIAAALEYPEFLNIGGNQGKVDTFAGVDLANLTGGVYNAQNILQGNNLACFGFQAGIQSAPVILKQIYPDITSALGQLNNALKPIAAALSCPQLVSIDESQFSKFPGYTQLKRGGTY